MMMIKLFLFRHPIITDWILYFHYFIVQLIDLINVNIKGKPRKSEMIKKIG